MSIKQISVFLENKPGTLKKLTSVMAKNKIDMRATSLAETKDFGIARIIVDDALQAVNTLKENDFVASLTSVLAVEIPDEAGGLDKLLDVFAAAEVNIEYMYAFPGKGNSNQAYMIFRVADTQAAEAKLTGKGLKLLSQDDIANM
ncbi:MAG: acetolactate synthase [Butyrivibrio sp.]|nr:acetolactate synthase [Butyrivibrio sp.]MBQ6408804.1 acetolactate synthase [Butyrivibrio sp.]